MCIAILSDRLTKGYVGSRRVVQWAAALMVLQGVVGKLGAVFIIIPQPIVGGLFCVMFGMISAFGLSALQYVDLNSARNLYIIGFSLFFPLVLTRWMTAHSGVIQTGVEALDAVLQVLLSTSILVGGLVGCFLDNLIPGTDEERGLAAWAKEMSLEAAGASEHGDTYDFPIGMSYIRRWKWTRYLPFMPTYEAGKFTALFTRKKES
ncbi:permease family domain-containing protein [Phthorimaea operculella]|nr:permease family domain-containing protein [Phthorimaea operculella]